jgi:SWI/SNF-related matrix-associated actin-dependent regulator 1 of chromatin subfamily A
MQPRHYQTVAAARLAASDVSLLHGDMGIGKTFISLLALRMAMSSAALVVCPAVAVSNWAREAGRVDPDLQVVTIRSGNDRIPANAGLVIVSYDLMCADAVQHQLAFRDWSVVVADEAHYLKSTDAKRTQAFWGTGRYRGRGIAEMAEHVWCLTGTPMPNNVSELYPLLASGMPDVIGKVTEDAFVRAYCRCIPTDYGLKIIGNKPEVSSLLDRMGDRYLRIRKDDVLSELPPMQIETMVVSGGEAAEKARKLGEEYRAQVQATLDGMPPTDHLASLMRLIEMAKAPAAAELALELVGAGRKVFLVAKHRDVIAYLADLLAPVGVAVVHGGVAHKARDKAIADFTEGAAQIFIGQIQAAGTAITLHGNGACQDVIAVSLDWVPATNAQAFARVHRIGQPGSVLVRVLALENSVDELVAEALARKTRMIDEVFHAA